MRKTALWVALLAVAAAADDVGDAKTELKNAYRSGEEILQVDAIRAASKILDKGVIDQIARGLRQKSPSVRRAAMEALGDMKHPDALKALHAAYWREKKVPDNDELFAELLKSIGRHGDPSSVRVLSDHPFKNLTAESGTARIMGLGNIRTRASVEALVKGSQKASDRGGRRRGYSDWRQIFDRPYRTAMTVLTGHDIGATREAWQQWWRQNGRGFDVPDKRPKVPQEVSEYFEGYWGVSYYEEGKEPDRKTLGSPYGRTENPSPSRVQEAVATIRDAFKQKDPSVKIAAIQSGADVIDDAVVRAIAKGLWDGNTAVRIEAVDALGWMKTSDSLKQLHRMYHRNKELYRQEELFAALLKAIGRHGNKSSIRVLKDAPFKNLTIASGSARILGLGRIRDRESVETLVKAMRLTGQNPRDPRRSAAPRYMDSFRVAMVILTGEDRGMIKDAWETWWRESKKTFKVAKELPKVPDDVKDRWENYWDEPYVEGAKG